MTKITLTTLALLLTLTAGCVEEDAPVFYSDAGVPEADAGPPVEEADAAVDSCASVFHVVSVDSSPDSPGDTMGSHVAWEQRPCSDDPLFSREGGRWVGAYHYGTDCPEFNPEAFAGLFASYSEAPDGCREYRIVRDWPAAVPLPEVP